MELRILPISPFVLMADVDRDVKTAMMVPIDTITRKSPEKKEPGSKKRSTPVRFGSLFLLQPLHESFDLNFREKSFIFRNGKLNFENLMTRKITGKMTGEMTRKILMTRRMSYAQ
jgi:hypothetical protein